MAANDRWILFAVSMGSVGVMALCLYLYRMTEMRRLRKELNRVTAVKLLCADDRVFDFNRLLKAYRISPRLKEVLFGDKFFYATFGGRKKKIRLTLSCTDGRSYLERIESYDKTWQLGDWRDEYEARNDNGSSKYVVVGIRELVKARNKRRMPSFYLTARAIEELTDVCAYCRT